MPDSLAAPAVPTRLADHKGLPLAGLMVAMVAWGTAPVFVREVSASGLTIAVYRAWTGIPVMWIVTYVSGNRMTWRILRFALPSGLLMGLEIALSFSALRATTVANVTLIGALSPVLVFLVAGRLFGDRITRTRMMWSGVALTGIAVVVIGGANAGHHSWWGDLLAVGDLVTWTAYFIETKRRRNDGIPAIALYTAVITTSVIVLTPLALAFSPDLWSIGGVDWLYLFGMAIVLGILGHTLFAWAHGHIDASVSSVLLLASNVIAVGLAWVVFHESLSVVQLGGGALVMIAIGFVTVESTGERGDRSASSARDVDLPVLPIDL